MITRTPLHPIGKRASKFVPSLLAGIAALSLLPATSRSATVFTFGPSQSYIGERLDFRRTATHTETAPHVSTVAFNASTPLSPAEGYSGPAFYGGYTFSSSSYKKGFDSQGQGLIDDYAALSDGNDALYFNVTSSNEALRSTTMSFASVFVFNQETFEAPFRQGNVSIDGFSIRLGKNATGTVNTRFIPQGRWLVEINDVYYLSNSLFSLTTNLEATSFTLNGEALLSTRWAVYNPETDLFFNAGDASFGNLALEQVTAVGFYIEDPSFVSSTGTVAMRLAVSEFSVTTIPEPGSFALLGLGLPILAGYLVRRSKKSAHSLQ